MCILNPARLPVPPPRHICSAHCIGNSNVVLQGSTSYLIIGVPYLSQLERIMATRRKLPSGKYQYIIRITGHAPVSRAFHIIKEGNNWVQVTEDAIRSGTYYEQSAITMPVLWSSSLNSIEHLASWRSDRYIIPALSGHLKHQTMQTYAVSYTLVHGRTGSLRPCYKHHAPAHWALIRSVNLC